MKLKNTSIVRNEYHSNLPLPSMRLISYLIFFLSLIGLTACTDFVEVDPPKNTLVSKTVFEDPETVKSALANIYYKMRDQGMVSGNSGLSVCMGIYSDELDYYGSDANNLQLFHHEVVASNMRLLSWWQEAYKLIYSANDIINGVDNTFTLTQDEKGPFKGQALFVRAYIHSLLVNLYGDIPYIVSTNYLQNNVVSRMPIDLVYENIISDLILAIDLLDGSDSSVEHVLPNQIVAKALLARIYLYTENWELAESMSNEVIEGHTLELDINKVFLKNASETLWQFKPDGINNMNTYEANQFVIRFIPGQFYALSNSLLEAFESKDLRYANWVASKTSSDGLTTLYYANKYKAIVSEKSSMEYSIVFRLAEQFLIRAEARAHLGDLVGAKEDINAIRNRAGLGNTTATDLSNLLDAILQERRVELFTEQGHRWFDLKRMGKASPALIPVKPSWKDTDVLFPIPSTELEINHNLQPQNSGY